MRPIALVTYARHPAPYGSDALLIEALRSYGYPAVGAAWNDPTQDWPRYAALLLRSTWDYQHHAADFRAWLAARAAEGVPLYNPASLVRWNMDKHYLHDLAQQGIRTPPTRYLEPGNPVDLAALLAAEGWQTAVIKPAISASAGDTWQVHAGNLADSQARLAQLVTTRRMLVQAFIPQIHAGEWSLIYVDGRFSHAILKRPAPGDMRVQAEYGGTAEALPADPALIDQGATIVAAAERLTGERPLYARVDGVALADELLLMELELIEPYLWLDAARAAHLAAALLRRL